MRHQYCVSMYVLALPLHETNNRKRFQAGEGHVFGYFITVHGEYIITVADNFPHRSLRP